MQVSTRALVVGTVATILFAGCSSRQSGGEPAIGNRTTAADESALTTSNASDEKGATTEAPVANSPDANVASKIAPPIIGQLKGRNHTIIIHSSADGPRFTVTTLDGRVIAAALTAEEMAAQHPEIYKTFKKTYAGQGGYLDASAAKHPGD